MNRHGRLADDSQILHVVVPKDTRNRILGCVCASEPSVSHVVRRFISEGLYRRICAGKSAHSDCRGEAGLGAVGASRLHQQERGNIDVGRNTSCDIVRNGRVDV